MGQTHSGPPGCHCNKLSFQRFSTYSAGDGINRRWIYLQPDSITSFLGLYQTVGSRMSPNHPDCTGMAQHAMVLGPSQHVSSNSPLTSPSGELLTQLFSQCPHRDLHNLNLHAWLLETQPFSRQVSLTKWQQELRLLRDVHPELSMSQSGPFLSDGVRKVRWTSGLLL